MLSQTMLVSLSSLLALAYANPVASAVPAAAARTSALDICGALDFDCPRPSPTAFAAAGAAAAAGGMTISIVNKDTVAITTAHTVGSTVGPNSETTPLPRPTSGNTAPGTLTPGQTAAFAVPTGWGGTVFLGTVEAGALNRDAGSIIEGSFAAPNTGAAAVEDIDVSYVTGFSVPITCSCATAGKVVTGCNKPLFKDNTCPNPTSGGVCANPERGNTTATSATPFFAPCMHEAYTYPNDNAANSYGQCGTSSIVCCVGTACPAYGAAV